MPRSERSELKRKAARLVRKIARLLDAGPEQTALLIWVDKIETAVRVTAKEATEVKTKRRVGRAATQLH